MKPLQGVSFDIGTKRAVSYFLSDGNSCELTLMLAEVVHGDEVNGLTATRATVPIEAGKAAHLDTVEGKTLEFRCQGRAQVMSVEASNQATYWQHHDKMLVVGAKVSNARGAPAVPRWHESPCRSGQRRRRRRAPAPRRMGRFRLRCPPSIARPRQRVSGNMEHHR
jgi:hypothetical protein